MALAINILRNTFFSSLASFQNVTSKKGTIAILTNVLLVTKKDSIEITGTDLEIGIKNSIPAEILSEGSITLPSKKLFELIKESSSDQIHIEEIENNWVKIEAGSSNYKLAGMPSEDFPSFPEYDTDCLVSLSGKLFEEIIDKIIFSIANEGESQFNLGGALFECETIENNKAHIRMLSSDGHRLSFMEKEFDCDVSKLEKDNKILIPRKGVQEIRKFCEFNDTVFFGIDEKQIILKTETAILIIRLLSGDFPDYKNIISLFDKDTFFKVERLSLLNSMKRMNIFTEDRFNVVQFDIDEKLTLTSQNIDIGNAKDEVEINYKGKPLQLFFNGKYFVDTLQVMNADNISIYISSENSPCFIKSEEDKGFLSIIMPMKI